MPYARLLAALCLSSFAMLALESDLSEQARQAKDAMLARRYGEAVEIYRRMVAAVPKEPGFHFNLALALHSSGRYREALQELEPIRTAERDNSKYWFLLGLGYLKLGDPRKATEPLRNAAGLDPANLDVRLELAGAYLESGQLDSAQRDFHRLSMEHPELPKVWEGLSLSQLGLSRRALESLEKTAPASSLRYGLAAVAEAEAGNTAKAVDLYKRALAAQPPAPWMRTELSVLEHADGVQSGTAGCAPESSACRFLKGDWLGVAEASAQLRTPEALYWTCRAYAQLARQSTEKLAGLPPSAEQHQMLARAYTELGQRTEAIAELRQAVKLSHDNPLTQGQLAKALWADRKYEEAITILVPLVAANPEQAEWQFELGDALFSLGKPEEAIGHLQKATSLASDVLAAQAKLGEALLQMGDAAGAIAHLERAESLDRDGSLHYQLAKAYRRVGKTELASRALARQKELQHNAGSHSH